MHKDATYQEKYAVLKDWMPSIIETVKKDLKNEHLKKDVYFAKKYLGAININKVTSEDLVQAYQKAIADEEKGEQVGEFITSRWLLKNSEIYEFFENRLSTLTADFSSLDELDKSFSNQLMEDSIREFGAPQTYLFAVLNSVVFPKEIFDRLQQRAKQDQHEKEEEQEVLSQKMTLESMQKAFETEIFRLKDKYEKKLNGLQKKYLVDVEGLKKQVAHLQRRLQEKN